jgi:hypothetical protein
MQAASEDAIFDRGAAEDRVVVSADTDFGPLRVARKGSQAVGHPLSGTAANVDSTIRQRSSKQTCHNSRRPSRPAASS